MTTSITEKKIILQVEYGYTTCMYDIDRNFVAMISNTKILNTEYPLW